MKITIITVALNAIDTINDTINSVSNQTYRNIEYIVLDGNSTDGTLNVIINNRNKISKYISEADHGIYHAMNKGIHLASGDIIGFLNADDFYHNNDIIEKIVSKFIITPIDCLWGDLVYIDKSNSAKIVRHWKSSAYQEGLFYRGWMPPHPTFFARKSIYDKYGDFNTNLKIAADYELMLRFLHKHKINGHYIPEILIDMRTGGVSNKGSNLINKSREDIKAWKLNDLKIKPYTILLKNISKIPQFINNRILGINN